MFIKKSEFEKLKRKIEVLEFKQDNPLGVAIIERPCLYFGKDYYLRYFKDRELREIKLGNNYSSNFELNKNGHIIEHIYAREVEYKFDIDKEILIQLKEIDLVAQRKKEMEKRYKEGKK